MTNRSLKKVPIILLFVFWSSCCFIQPDPRIAIEEKYAFAVREAEIGVMNARDSGNRQQWLQANMMLDLTKIDLGSTKMRTANMKIKKLGGKPNSMPNSCEGRGE